MRQLYDFVLNLPEFLFVVLLLVLLVILLIRPPKMPVAMPLATAFFFPFCLTDFYRRILLAAVERVSEALLGPDPLLLVISVTHGLTAVALLVLAKPFVAWRSSTGKQSLYYSEQHPAAGLHALRALAVLCAADALLAAGLYLFA